MGDRFAIAAEFCLGRIQIGLDFPHDPFQLLKELTGAGGLVIPASDLIGCAFHDAPRAGCTREP